MEAINIKHSAADGVVAVEAETVVLQEIGIGTVDDPHLGHRLVEIIEIILDLLGIGHRVSMGVVDVAVVLEVVEAEAEVIETMMMDHKDGNDGEKQKIFKMKKNQCQRKNLSRILDCQEFLQQKQIQSSK